MTRPARAFFSTSLALVAFAYGAAAGRVQVVTPDELMTRASVVVNAIPLQIAPTGEHGRKGDSEAPTRLVLAHLKVIGVVKGSAPGEIELRYPVLDIDAFRGALINSPADIALETGRRYRFYLREAPGQGAYVGALDGEIDDAGAVEPLDDREADAAGPLLREDAMKHASDYVKSSMPAADFSRLQVETRYRRLEPCWSFTFYFGDPAAYPSGASDAEIVIAGDGSIDARSWVAQGIYRSAEQIDESKVGRAVRLILQPPRAADPAAPTETVSGRINAVDADTIELHGASPGTAPADLEIPKSEIVAVVLLAE